MPQPQDVTHELVAGSGAMVEAVDLVASRDGSVRERVKSGNGDEDEMWDVGRSV